MPHAGEPDVRRVPVLAGHEGTAVDLRHGLAGDRSSGRRASAGWSETVLVSLRPLVNVP